MNLAVKRLRRNCELLICQFYFYLCNHLLDNKILAFCPFLLYKFFGDWDWFIVPDAVSSQYRAVSGAVIGPLLFREAEADITFI